MSFPKYPKYKDSGEEWLGEVPDGWDVARLGHFAREVRVKVNDTDWPPLSVTKNGVVPQLETAAKTDDNDNRKRVRKGEYVINGRSDRKGSSGVAELDGSVSLINIVLELFGINSQFAHHLFRSVPFQEEFYRFGKGIVADLWSTGFAEMSNILLAIPPDTEQRQIATFLDQETEKIDALIEEQRRLIELLKEKRQAVISHAVTGAAINGPFRQIEIGRVCLRIEQGWSPQAEDRFPESHEYGVLRLSAVRRGDFVTTEVKALESDIRIPENLLLRKGDLLITRANTPELVGDSCYVDKGPLKVIFSDLVYRLTLDPTIITHEFANFALQSANSRSQARRDARGSSMSMAKLSHSHIKRWTLPVPPVEMQAEIVSRIKSQLAQIDNLQQSADGAIALLQERRSALISAAVTGKIDVRGAFRKPVQATWQSGFARQVLAAEALRQCNGPTMGRIKLQKLIHLCEYHAQLDEIAGNYSRKAAGPFDSSVMAGVRKGLKQQKWFEEYKEGSRYAYRPMEKVGAHEPYLTHWADKKAKIDQVLGLFRSLPTRTCEIASTLYAAWNDLLLERKAPTDNEIIHEASSAERWHESKEKIAPEKWPRALAWMRANGLVPVGYGAHTKLAGDTSSKGDQEEPR